MAEGKGGGMNMSDPHMWGMLLGGLGTGLGQMSSGRPVNIMNDMMRQQLYMEQRKKKLAQKKAFDEAMADFQKSGTDTAIIDKFRADQDRFDQGPLRDPNYRERRPAEREAILSQAQALQDRANAPSMDPKLAKLIGSMGPDRGAAALVNYMTQSNIKTSFHEGKMLISNSKTGELLSVKPIPKTEAEQRLAKAELVKAEDEAGRINAANAERQITTGGGGGGGTTTAPTTSAAATGGGNQLTNAQRAIQAAGTLQAPTTQPRELAGGFAVTPPADVRAFKQMGKDNVPLTRRQQIIDAANRHGIDPSLLAAQVKTESNYKADALGPEVDGQKAHGLMQIMPSTAASLGLAKEDLLDPVKNLDAGARYLKERIAKRGGNVGWGLQDYQAGAGNVNAAARGEPSKFGEHSAAYVPTIAEAAGIPLRVDAFTEGGAVNNKETAAVVDSEQLRERMLNAPYNAAERAAIRTSKDPGKTKLDIQENRQKAYDAEQQLAVRRQGEERLQSAEQRQRTTALQSGYRTDSELMRGRMQSVKDGIDPHAAEFTLIASYIRMVDPSAIRQGELILATPGLISDSNRFLITWYKAFKEYEKTGDVKNLRILTDGQRQYLQNELIRMGIPAQEKLLKSRDRYTRMANEWDVKPFMVMKDFERVDFAAADQKLKDHYGDKEEAEVKASEEAKALKAEIDAMLAAEDKERARWKGEAGVSSGTSP